MFRKSLKFSFVTLALLCLLSLFVPSCTEEKDYQAMMRPETSIEIHSGWEYRWGDSSHTNAQFDWLTPAQQNSTEWKTMSFPTSSPPERTYGNTNVWIRTTIPHTNTPDPSLFLLGVDQAVEVFIDGKSIYNFGSISKEGVGNFTGYAWHIIRIPKSAEGNKIYFRIWSKHINIGIVGRVFIGTKTTFINNIISESAHYLLSGIIIIIMGIASLLMFLGHRSQMEYFYFFLHTFMGLWILCRSTLKFIIYPDPQFWLVSELIALQLGAVGFCGFVSNVFGAGWKQILQKFVSIGFVIALTIPCVAFFAFNQIMKILAPVQIYIVLGSIFITAQTIIAFRRKILEAKVIAIGLLAFLFTATLEVLMAIGLIFPQFMGKAPFMIWGMLLFAFSLVVILVLRFIAVQKRSERLKLQLEKILDGTKEMAAAHEKIDAISKAIAYLIKEVKFPPETNADVFLPNFKNGETNFLYARVLDKGIQILTPLPEITKGDKLDNLKQMNSLVANGEIVSNSKYPLLIPLRLGTQMEGVFLFDQAPLTEFGDLDRKFIETLFQSLALSISNINFVAETQEKAELNAELNAAKVVQESLILPSEKIPGVDIVSFYRSANHTGGDWIGHYYDKENHRLDFFVGDVTGHGFGASLITSVAYGGVYGSEELLATIKSESECESTTKQSPEERLTRIAQVVNKLVFQSGHQTLMMTMAFISIDLETGECVFLNAGHNPPYWIRQAEKEARCQVTRGNRLGYSLTPRFGIKKFTLNPGDAIFAYTDGLIENTGPDNDSTFLIYDVKKILTSSTQIREIHNNIIKKAESIWKNHPPCDDIATLAVQWMGPVSRVL